MRKDAPYSYHLLVGDRQLGPYDRKMIVGMHVKKLVDHNAMVRRSDGHEMTVAQLQADRFEMADADSLHSQATSPPASGFWPTFLINCGGSLMKPGAFGFIGRGELRFQGDYLRLTANRKSGLVSTRLERIKVPLSAIFSASAHAEHTKFLLLKLKAGHAVEGVLGGGSAMIALDDAEAVKELLELMNLS
ncbi:MAG: hypothetical protein EAZ37_09540 [Burkholderiales bacterium]|nr:MAG: hypothetical protein EAZ37_09540 [Burkholderiales bacterium]